jgi:anti-anti-sigma regulatory factor
MDISVSTEKGRVEVTVVHVDGNIDSSSYEDFEKRVQGLIEAGARYVLIDLSHVAFMSSAGLRALNSLFSRLRILAPDGTEEEVKQGIRDGSYHSKHIKLLNPNKDVHQVLEMSGFDMYLEIHKELKEAVDSF